MEEISVVHRGVEVNLLEDVLNLYRMSREGRRVLLMSSVEGLDLFCNHQICLLSLETFLGTQNTFWECIVPEKIHTPAQKKLQIPPLWTFSRYLIFPLLLLLLLLLNLSQM